MKNHEKIKRISGKKSELRIKSCSVNIAVDQQAEMENNVVFVALGGCNELCPESSNDVLESSK